jgi:hypothetical protein
METKVFTNFRAPVNSYPLGEMNLGIFTPGRYSGFDVLSGASLTIKISHSGIIKKSTPSVGGVISEIIFGTLLMPNGCTIQSELAGGEGHEFIIDNNLGNANPRYDLVVCEHEYVQISGGVAPIFLIQKGANDGLVPALAIPKKQVIVGIIRIDANGNAFGSLEYTKSPVPLLGDQTQSEFQDDNGITEEIENVAEEVAELGIMDVITNDPLIEGDATVQLGNTSIFQIIRNLISSVAANWYGAFTVDHTGAQTAGTMKSQIGIQSVIGGWTFLRFLVGSTIFDDDANGKGIEYAADYSANFTARSLIDKAYTDAAITAAINAIALKVPFQRGYVSGVVSGGGTPGDPVTHGGDITAATIVSSAGEGTTILITVPNIGTTNYKVNMQLESLGDIGADHDCLAPVFKIISATQYQISVADVGTGGQNLKVHQEVIKL